MKILTAGKKNTRAYCTVHEEGDGWPTAWMTGGQIFFCGVMQRRRRTITGNPGFTSNVKNANAERGNRNKNK